MKNDWKVLYILPVLLFNRKVIQLRRSFFLFLFWEFPFQCVAHQHLDLLAEILALHPREIAGILLGDLAQTLLARVLSEHHVKFPVPPAEPPVSVKKFRLFPVFFGFRGGKGVATALGVQFGLWGSVFGFWCPVGLPVALIWLFVAKVLKFSSLAALISMALAPLIVWLMGLPPVLIGMQLVMTGLLIWRHRSNIEKLLTGREGRLTGQPGPSDQD